MNEPGQAGLGWMVVLRRQPVWIVAGRVEGGYTDAYELVCCEVAAAEYFGRSEAFDRSITDFSERYGDQNEQDYKQFVKAIRSGRLEAVEGV